MLARTASNLYWLARDLERADYTARLLLSAAHLSAVRADGDRDSEWRAALAASGSSLENADSTRVVRYLAFDSSNASSIVSCLENARRNARAVRTALTVDMWDAVNGTWLELRSFDPAKMDEDRLSAFLDWVKARTGLFHGAYASTLLRTDGFRFTRLGQFLERADNSARLLAERVSASLSTSDAQNIDDQAALAVLRVVGARRAYRVFYKGRVAPRAVAELLMLRPEFPRSLVYCFEQITQQLAEIRDQDPRQSAECKRLAHLMYAQLRFGRIDDVLDAHPTARLRDLIARIGEISAQVARGYCF